MGERTQLLIRIEDEDHKQHFAKLTILSTDYLKF